MDNPVVETSEVKRGFFSRIKDIPGFFRSTNHRALTIVAIIIVVAAIPLTVFIAQKQQEIRQRASGTTCTTMTTADGCRASLAIVLKYNSTCTCSGLDLCCGVAPATTTTTASKPTTTTSGNKPSCPAISTSTYAVACMASCTNGWSGTTWDSKFSCTSGQHCCYHAGAVGATSTTTTAPTPTVIPTTKVCHSNPCGSIRYCASQTWTQAYTPVCNINDPSVANIQTNQPVCSCNTGSAGNCGSISAADLLASCDPSTTPDNRCSRCSDIYKYCGVTYDKTNGVCGNGDNASGKVYGLACDCTLGTDTGSCGGVSTAQCKSTPTPSVSPTATPTLTPTQTPTPTVTPIPTTVITTTTTTKHGDTLFAFTLGLDGIGATGDNKKPCNDFASCESNKTLVKTTYNVKVWVLDNQNATKIDSKPGTITYNSNTGLFTGTVNTGNTLTTGVYTVKVKADGFLKKLIPGIQTITAGTTNSMPLANLTNGDIDGDNKLTIFDYNILISCTQYSADSSLCGQNANYKIFSDLDSDGHINQYDYNLFVREYSIQNGD